jgi:hypothetical protein
MIKMNQPIYEDFTIRMLQSGVYRYCGVHGFNKGDTYHTSDELMSPRLAINMVNLGWAEKIEVA